VDAGPVKSHRERGLVGEEYISGGIGKADEQRDFCTMTLVLPAVIF